MMDKKVAYERLNLYLRGELNGPMKQAFEERILKYRYPHDEEEIKKRILALKHMKSESYVFAIVFKDDAPHRIYSVQDHSDYDINRYAHLTETISVKIPDIAVQLMSINYGQSRMLAEIVKQREVNPNNYKYPIYAEHTRKLRQLLEEGWH